MIRFTLKCPADHVFESWFQSGAAFDALCTAGHVACPVCGATGVEKTLMTPMVSLAKAAPGGTALTTPDPDPRAKAIEKLRAEVEAKSDYVGTEFVAQARRMHAGDAPERAIHGEARLDEAAKLIADGVPIAPLPFLPRRKVN